MDNHTPAQRHKNMAAVRSRDTGIEVALRKLLWRSGVRYRKNFKIRGCRADIAITKYRIAVFCDGDFWHGRDFHEGMTATNAAFWDGKIRANMERDFRNLLELRDAGWLVARFWGTDIKKDPEGCLGEVLRLIELRKACTAARGAKKQAEEEGR